MRNYKEIRKYFELTDNKNTNSKPMGCMQKPCTESNLEL